MWYLKFKYKHKDCIYSPKLEELGLLVHFYFLGFYEKRNYNYTTALQHIFGDKSQIKKYISYMKKHPKIVNIEIYGDVIITVAKHRKEIELYSKGYNQMFIRPSPAYVSKEGFEIIEIAFWDRKPLQDFIKALERNKTTTVTPVVEIINNTFNKTYFSTFG